MLESFSIFADLDLSERSHLSAMMKMAVVPARTVLLTAGLPGHAVYFLTEGSVRICLERPVRLTRKAAKSRQISHPLDTSLGDLTSDAPISGAQDPKAQASGSQVMLNLCGPGAVLGEMSLIDGGVHSASVIARQSCRLLWMDKDAFRAALREMPAIPLALLRECSIRLRNTTQQLHAFATLDATGRIAHTLLRLGDQFGASTPEGLRLDLHLTQPEVADLTGLTRVRVNTIFSRFKQEGWLSHEADGALLLRDVANLAACARLSF